MSTIIIGVIILLAVAVAWKKFLSSKRPRRSPRQFLRDKKVVRTSQSTAQPKGSPQQARDFLQQKTDSRERRSVDQFLDEKISAPENPPAPETAPETFSAPKIIPETKTEPQKYLDLLRDTAEIESYLSQRGEELNWCRSALNKLAKDIGKSENLFAQAYKNELTGEQASKAVSILSRLIQPLETCYRAPEKYRELLTVLENYYQKLGVTKALNPSTGKDFQAGDDYEDWVELDLDSEAIPKNTDDDSLHNKIFSVNLPPYCFRDGKTEINFGGQCVVWSCRKE